MKKYNYNKNKKCMICKKLIDNRAIRCCKCNAQGKFNGNFKYHISKKELIKLYIKQKYTLQKIANFFNCSVCVIQNKFKIYKINARKNSYYDVWNKGTIGLYSKEYRKKLSDNHADFRGKKSGTFGKIYHGKSGKYKGIWMRSSWEIAYAKYLDRQRIKWIYESKTFDLGETTYTPDFYLPEQDLYIEIKGYWREDALKKFKIFKKLYKNIKLSILEKKELQKLGII